MRVLHVINRFSVAGAETSLRELIAATASEVDHAVAVLHSDRNRFDEPGLERLVSFVPNPGSGGYPARIRHVSQAIDAFRPDLVHTTLFEADTAGRIAAHRAGVRVLTSLVNTPYVAEARLDRHIPLWKHRAVRLVDRALSRHWTTHFHAITNAVADAYVADFGLDRERITVVPRGRTRDRLGEPSMQRRARVRRELGLDDSAPVILAVGRQEAQKGHRFLLDAAPAIASVHPDVRILVAGRPGGMTDQLQGRLGELGLEDRFVFLGFRDDIPDLLASADLFAFPSLYEGLGGAVLEAMALNLPVIASDVPALREVLDDGRCGVLVPPGDADALAGACVDLLSSPKRAAALAAAGRSRFEAEYSAEAMTHAMLTLYRRLAAS